MTQMFHNFTLQLLDWYDQNKRDLPWRSDDPNPYHVWLSEIMLQQTTVTAVKTYFLKFLDHYPTVQDLAQADEDTIMADWAGLGYYSRARNLHKASKIIASNGFPSDLTELAGVGRYTAAAINTIAFNKPAVVVDGNIERVMARVFKVEEPLPKAKPYLYELATPFFMEAHQNRSGDLAQAFMDLGSSICLPKNPKCDMCPINEFCKAQSDEYPKRAKKANKPQRTATCFWIENEAGEVLFEKRPPKGLLGGTIGLPCTDLTTGAMPDLMIDSGDTIGEVRHIFTHFALTMTIQKASVKGAIPSNCFWQKPENASGLSSLFRKVCLF